MPNYVENHLRKIKYMNAFDLNSLKNNNHTIMSTTFVGVETLVDDNRKTKICVDFLIYYIRFKKSQE